MNVLSLPLPLSVSGFVIITRLVCEFFVSPAEYSPSANTPAPMFTVSPALAAFTARWIVRNGACAVPALESLPPFATNHSAAQRLFAKAKQRRSPKRPPLPLRRPFLSFLNFITVLLSNWR